MVQGILRILSSPKSLISVSFVLLLAFGGLFYADAEVKKSAESLHTLTVNAERILASDLRATTAVRLAASLESDRYVINYQNYQDSKYALLEENLKLQTDETIAKSLSKMEEVQGDIEDAESEAIALIDEEEWEEALELVTDPSFSRQKGIYRANLSSALHAMIQASQGQADRSTALARAVQFGVLGTFAFLAFIGFLYSREMQHSLRIQSELSANLEDANENLEQRVIERTAELDESRSLFQTVLDSMPAAVFLKSPEGRFRLVNRYYETLYGLRGDEVRDKTLYDLHPRDLAETYSQFDRQLIDAGDLLERENTIEVDGKETVLNSIMFPVFNQSGALTSYGGIEIDITERKAAEAELARQKAIADTTMETMDQGITMFDGEFKLTAHNAKLRDIIDLPAHLLVEGTPIEDWYRHIAGRGEYGNDAFGGDDSDAQVAKRMESVRRGEAIVYERATADGRMIEVRRNPVADGGFVSTYTDITERKQAEQELARQKAIADLTLENMDQGITMFDAEFKLTAHNSMLEGMVDLPAHLLAEGTPVEDWYRHIAARGDYGTDEAFGGTDLETQVAKRMASVRNGEQVIYERPTHDGRVIEIRRNPIDAGGFVSTYTDVTERKQGEAELARQKAIADTTLENMDQGITMFDDDLNVVMFNQRVIDILQIPRELMESGPNLADLFRYNAERGEYGPGDKEEQVRSRIELAAKFEPHQFERTRPDGMVIEIRGNPVATGGFVTTYTDVTERKQAEARIAQQEAQLRAALDNMSDGIFMLDGDQRYLIYNQRYIDLVGIPEELFEAGRPIRDVLTFAAEHGFYGPGDPIEQVEARMASYLDDAYIEIELETHLGRTLALRKTAIESGGAVAILSDITERKQAEEALKEQTQLVQLLHESAVSANQAQVVEDALRGCIKAVCTYNEWPVGHVYHCHPTDPETLVSTGIWHLADPERFATFRQITTEATFARGVGLPGRVFASGKPAWIVDVTKDKNFPRAKLADDIGVKAGFAVPVMVGDEVTAVMEFFAAEATEPDESLISVLDNIANQVGRVVERKRAEARLQDAYDIITGSIEYATRIQQSVLPAPEFLSTKFADHFVLWEPRDRVGGDIYWCREWGDGLLTILVDCTGHGVPGAFMTLIATGALDRAQEEVAPGDVGALITRMHQYVQLFLGQQAATSSTDDGLELGACYMNGGTSEMVFAGARFSLFRVADGAIEEIKGDKKGIGYNGIPFEADFTPQAVKGVDGCSFYLTTDGFIDQVGGERRRMYGKKRFKELVLSVQNLPFAEQKERLVDSLREFQGDEVRRDDVSILGFKI